MENVRESERTTRSPIEPPIAPAKVATLRELLREPPLDVIVLGSRAMCIVKDER